MRKRHHFFWWLLRPLIIVFLWVKFGYTFKKAKELPENYIVLSNHATDYDPLLVAASFPRQMYFVASEHIARWKRAFKWLDFVFAPIMRYKGTVAASTVAEVLRRLRKGANVAVFAEGARTWDGVTGPILPSTAKMVKKAGCGLVTYKLIGGHFISPMWSYNTRRGYCHGEVVNVYTKERLAAMSQNEVYEAIVRDLYEDAYARQAEQSYEYRGKRLAAGLENLLFICPKCGGYDTLSSSDDAMTCDKCGLTVKYTPDAKLEGAPFSTVKAFSDWQTEQVQADIARGTVYRAAMQSVSLGFWPMPSNSTQCCPLASSVSVTSCSAPLALAAFLPVTIRQTLPSFASSFALLRTQPAPVISLTGIYEFSVMRIPPIFLFFHDTTVFFFAPLFSEQIRKSS